MNTTGSIFDAQVQMRFLCARVSGTPGAPAVFSPVTLLVERPVLSLQSGCFIFACGCTEIAANWKVDKKSLDEVIGHISTLISTLPC